jgi:hypothetical protein
MSKFNKFFIKTLIVSVLISLALSITSFVLFVCLCFSYYVNPISVDTITKIGTYTFFVTTSLAAIADITINRLINKRM